MGNKKITDLGAKFGIAGVFGPFYDRNCTIGMNKISLDGAWPGKDRLAYFDMELNNIGSISQV